MAAAVAFPPAAAASDVFALSPGRIGAIVAGLTGLVAVIVAGRALARGAGRSGTRNGRSAALVALVLGPVAVALGGLVVVTADGGLGTGNGLGGGVVAMLAGLI